MAVAWNFPDSLYGAIRYHHSYQQAGDAKPIALLVHVANLFAHAIGLGGYSLEGPVNLAEKPAPRELGLAPDEIAGLKSDLSETTHRLIESFGEG